MGADRKTERAVSKNPMLGCTFYREPVPNLSRDDHFALWEKGLSSFQFDGILPIEIQYEFPYKSEYWRDIVDLISKKILYPSVHAPIKDRDIASLDNTTREHGVAETLLAMDFASQLKSPYFILHLTPHDNFDNRKQQVVEGLRSFQEIVDYKNKNGYEFQILIETIEYPKWPSNEEETVALLKAALQIDATVGVCVDVAHLWHNMTWLSPDANNNVDFPAKLEQFLNNVNSVAPIKRFHMGGAYVDLSGGVDDHQTHAIPGHYGAYDYYDSPPHNFKGLWMPINTVFSKITSFIDSLNASKNNIVAPDIILEIHESDMQLQINAVKKIDEIFKR